MVKEVDKKSSLIYQHENKGFTLIELLAVIAILGILVVLAVSNIIKIYNNAKKSSFIVGVQNIYATTNDQVMENQINNDEITRFYYAGENSENPLELSGNKKVYYDIEIANEKIIKFLVSNNEYSLNLENSNGINISDITKDTIKEKGTEGYIAVEAGTNEIKIYGVEFNLTTGVYTRTDDAIGMNYTINTSTIDSDFDNADIYKEMTEETDSYGNVFIKIPKFYIKKTVNTDYTIWKYQISKEKKDSNYYLPACFLDEDTGTEYPYILVGKYNASLSDDGTMLESKSGKVPLVNIEIWNLRPLAIANGTGYQLLDIHTLDVLQTLFYIEFATLDSTSIIYGFGTGQSSVQISAINGKTLTLPAGVAANFRVGQMISVSISGDLIATNLRIANINGNTITYEVISGISIEKVGSTAISVGHKVNNVAYITGLTDSVTTKSGSLIDNISGKYPMKYRGIENLYGNIDQYVDGIDFRNETVYVAKNPKQYSSAEAYTQIGYWPEITFDYSRFVIRMGYDINNPYIQLPIETAQYTNGMYKDGYQQDSYDCYSTATFGGSWSDGSNSGLSNWFITQRPIGVGRLLYID